MVSRNFDKDTTVFSNLKTERHFGRILKLENCIYNNFLNLSRMASIFQVLIKKVLYLIYIIININFNYQFIYSNLNLQSFYI